MSFSSNIVIVIFDITYSPYHNETGMEIIVFAVKGLHWQAFDKHYTVTIHKPHYDHILYRLFLLHNLSETLTLCS